MVLGVMMCGIELIGWKESAEMERIQLKYIKRSLVLDGWTLGYIVLTEINGEKIRIKVGRRVIILRKI